MSLWGALWRSHNRLDGKDEHLLSHEGTPAIFTTRRAARVWIERQYGYIRNRPDLQREPHGWKVPIPIRITVRPTAKPRRPEPRGGGPTAGGRAMSAEKRLAEWAKQPGAVIRPTDRRFIEAVREAAAQGVGYGAMQQIVEWEWQAKDPHSWGPEYFNAEVARLESECARLKSVLAFYANEKNWGPVTNYTDDYWYIHHKAPWRLAAEALGDSPKGDGGKEGT